MTIASAFNEIAVAQGGTANPSGTIAGAIDALNDALAGSDQQQAKTIEQAVRLLGEHIGGGGGGGDVTPDGFYFVTYDQNGQLNKTWTELQTMYANGHGWIFITSAVVDPSYVSNVGFEDGVYYVDTTRIADASITAAYETQTADGYPVLA